MADYGDEIAESKAVIKTYWATDPFSLGSYSIMPPGSTICDRIGGATIHG